MSDLPHLRVEGTAKTVRYTSPSRGAGEFALPPRDRPTHAEHLKRELRQVEADVSTLRQEQGLPEQSSGEILCVRSDQGFELKLDSLERLSSGIELLSARTEDAVTVANIFVPRGKFVHLLKLVDAYEHQNSQKGLPKNRKLIESIAFIRLAAVRDLWQDVASFPATTQNLWWEVWLRREGNKALPSEVHAGFAVLARQRGMRVSTQFVSFPERVVTLSYGQVEQISGSRSPGADRGTEASQGAVYRLSRAFTARPGRVGTRASEPLGPSWSGRAGRLHSGHRRQSRTSSACSCPKPVEHADRQC